MIYRTEFVLEAGVYEKYVLKCTTIYWLAVLQ